jgi:hypothetical protein
MSPLRRCRELTTAPPPGQVGGVETVGSPAVGSAAEAGAAAAELAPVVPAAAAGSATAAAPRARDRPEATRR